MADLNPSSSPSSDSEPEELETGTSLPMMKEMNGKEPDDMEKKERRCSEDDQGGASVVIPTDGGDDRNDEENDLREVQQGPCLSFRDWLTSNAFLIYCSQFLSAWGDRMWTFVVAIYLVEIEDFSLRLTAVFGFALTVSVLMFGSLVGQWVDRTPRLSAARKSLVVQNLCVILCAVCLLLVLHYKVAILQVGDGILFFFCESLIILLGVIANLASVAEKICIQKDWVVILAGGSKEQLAVMNANVRRIDLTVNILAPILVGQIMTFASMNVAGIFIASWNVVSLVLEYGLLLRVYKKVPRLAIKITSSAEREHATATETETLTGESNSTSCHPKEGCITQEGSKPVEGDMKLAELNGEAHTVAGEDSGDGDQLQKAAATGETAESIERSSSKDQVNESTEEQDPSTDRDSGGAVQQQPAKKLRPLRRIAAVFLSTYHGWKVYRSYPVHLAGLALAFLYMTVMGFDSITNGYGYAMGLNESTLGIIRGLGSIAGILGTFTFSRMRLRIGTTRTGLYALSQEVMCLTLCVVSIWMPGSPFNPRYYEENPNPTSSRTPVFVTATPFLLTTSTHSFPGGFSNATTPNLSGNFSDVKRSVGNTSDEGIEASTVQGSTNTTQGGDEVGRPLFDYTSSILFFGGMIISRVGLWMFDLVTTQLIQENVRELERGAFSGMQRSLECFMDMLHFILVIILPAPETFGFLIILSFVFICIGAVLYYIFSFRERGHLFHTEKVTACFHKGASRSNGVTHTTLQDVTV